MRFNVINYVVFYLEVFCGGFPNIYLRSLFILPPPQLELCEGKDPAAFSLFPGCCLFSLFNAFHSQYKAMGAS